MNYYDRPEWSYSSMKKILESGIDYAVAAKRGDLPQPQSAFIDLGQLVHFLFLGGDDNFAVSEFDNYRTKVAQEWKKQQLELGKNIVTKKQWEQAEQILKNIENHPHSKDYLYGKGVKYEQAMFAKANGVSLKGKADVVKVKDEALTITDLKTTAQFDKFVKTSQWNHLDLQAAVYSLVGAKHLKLDTNMVNYYFCVAETVEPYRVQFMHASLEFMENGERKLADCLEKINEFGDREPSFLLEEIKELGDWSL